MRPSNIIWLWKFFAIQIKFNGSPTIGDVVLTREARLEAWREQIQSPGESCMQNPMYPTRISSAGVEFVLTSFENVVKSEGFTCAASG